jgi:DNA-binding transcriptional MerR regulator
MPYKEKTVEKLFWSIGEVAEELGVNTSLIRYWEKEFGHVLRPRRNSKGDRLYTTKEIEQLRRIRELVKGQGFTLNGAKERLRSGAEEQRPADRIADVRARLMGIRQSLLELRERC